MVGEDLSGSRGQKPSSKNIQVYFGTIPGKAQERVIMFVDRWLATARHFGVMQSQSVRVVAEGKHNMDEADARLIGLDNRLRHLALGLKLLEAAFDRSQLVLQIRSFCGSLARDGPRSPSSMDRRDRSINFSCVSMPLCNRVIAA